MTATTSKSPVFAGTDLAEGTHINAIGGNFLQKSEVDVETIRRSGTIVCDSLQQCRIEAGEFVQPLQEQVVCLEDLSELKDVVAGSVPGRKSEAECTFFKSVGLAMEDVAMAGRLLALARDQGAGQELPF